MRVKYNEITYKAKTRNKWNLYRSRKSGTESSVEFLPVVAAITSKSASETYSVCIWSCLLQYECWFSFDQMKNAVNVVIYKSTDIKY